MSLKSCPNSCAKNLKLSPLLKASSPINFHVVTNWVDQRFEQVDKRFEQIDQRFEQVDQRFEQMHPSLLELKRRIIKVESGLDRVVDKMTKFDAWLKVISGDLGTEKGQTLEDLFAIALP